MIFVHASYITENCTEVVTYRKLELLLYSYPEVTTQKLSHVTIKPQIVFISCF